MGAERVPEGAAGVAALRLATPDEAASPVTTWLIWQPANGAIVSAIGRAWEETARPTCGDLCGDLGCTFRDGFCLVTAKGRLTQEQAQRYRRN